MTDEITPAPILEDVTEEMVNAFLALRRLSDVLSNDKGGSKGAEVAHDFDTLDKAGFFAPIREALAYEEKLHAQLMAGLQGIDLNDRYPRGDENGIIGRAGEGPGFLGWRGPDH